LYSGWVEKINARELRSDRTLTAEHPTLLLCPAFYDSEYDARSHMVAVTGAKFARSVFFARQ